MKHILLIIFLGVILFACEKKEASEDAGIKNKHRISEITIVRPDIFDVRVNFIYDGEKLSEMVYHGNSSNSNIWVPFSKTRYSYNGNRVSGERSEIKTVEWRITDKIDFVFENGNVIEESFYDYISNEWVLQYKFTYTYDGSKLTSYRNYVMDTATNDIVSAYKGDYIYADDTLKEYIRYMFYDENVSLPDDRFVFNYSEGKMKSYIEYSQNLSEEWVELLKCEYKFLASGPYEARIFIWNAENESWVDESYYLRFAYNNFGYMAKRLFWDGLEYTYNYEEGHGNAALLYYFPEELVFGEPVLKSTSLSAIHDDIFDRMNPLNRAFTDSPF